MKTFSRILNILTSVLVMIIGLAFLVIEGYLLFSGDFLLFEWEFLAFLQILLRLLLAVGAILLGLFTIIKKEKAFTYESLVALICVVAMAPFLSNGFGLYFFILAALFAITNAFYSRYINRQ